MNRMGGGLGFLRGIVVFETALGLLEIHHALFPSWYVGTAFIANMQNAGGCTPDRAGMG